MNDPAVHLYSCPTCPRCDCVIRCVFGLFRVLSTQNQARLKASWYTERALISRWFGSCRQIFEHQICIIRKEPLWIIGGASNDCIDSPIRKMPGCQMLCNKELNACSMDIWKERQYTPSDLLFSFNDGRNKIKKKWTLWFQFLYRCNESLMASNSIHHVCANQSSCMILAFKSM